MGLGVRLSKNFLTLRKLVHNKYSMLTFSQIFSLTFVKSSALQLVIGMAKKRNMQASRHVDLDCAEAGIKVSEIWRCLMSGLWNWDRKPRSRKNGQLGEELLGEGMFYSTCPPLFVKSCKWEVNSDKSWECYF